jgi:cytoskeletal protein RodZ
MATFEPPGPPGEDEGGPRLSGVQRAGIVLGALGVLLIAFVIARGADDQPSRSSTATTATEGQSSAPPTGDGATATTGTTETTETETETETEMETTTTTTRTTTQTQRQAPPVPTINVVGGQPRGGVRTLSFERGERIRFKVRSDVADEVHVHGYDVSRDVSAGGTVQFSFTGNIEGRFEVELESRHVKIAELEVTPS